MGVASSLIVSTPLACRWAIPCRSIGRTDTLPPAGRRHQHHRDPPADPVERYRYHRACRLAPDLGDETAVGRKRQENDASPVRPDSSPASVLNRIPVATSKGVI